MNKLFYYTSLIALALPALAQTEFSLDQCRKYAWKNSPRLQKLDISLSDQKLSTEIAKARFDLSLSSSLDHNPDENTEQYSSTLNKEIAGGIDVSISGSTLRGGQDAFDSSDLSFSISKQILGGGSRNDSLLQINNSLISELIRANDIRKAKRQISFEVESSFYQIIRNIQSLKIEKSRLASAQKSLEHARERGNPLDISAAELDVPQREQSVLRAERNINNGLDQLKETIGYNIDDKFTIIPDFKYTPSEVNPDKDLLKTTEQDEDFLNVGLEQKIFNNELEVADESLLPNLYLSYRQRLNSDDDSRALHGDSDKIVSLDFEWTWDRKVKKTRLARVKNDLLNTKTDYFILLQSKKTTLRGLHRRLMEVAMSIELQEQQIKINSRRVELYKDRWENGASDILELVRSRNQLENSRIDLINLKTNYMELLSEYRFEAAIQ